MFEVQFFVFGLLSFAKIAKFEKISTPKVNQSYHKSHKDNQSSLFVYVIQHKKVSASITLSQKATSSLACLNPAPYLFTSIYRLFYPPSTESISEHMFLKRRAIGIMSFLAVVYVLRRCFVRCLI